MSGIGKPEPGMYGISGAWSRRITDEHRLAYQARDDEESADMPLEGGAGLVDLLADQQRSLHLLLRPARRVVRRVGPCPAVNTSRTHCSEVANYPATATSTLSERNVASALLSGYRNVINYEVGSSQSREHDCQDFDGPSTQLCLAPVSGRPRTLAIESSALQARFGLPGLGGNSRTHGQPNL